GTDPDRFAEEKARGLTIDLGFAACDLPGGRRLELVDVPGHVRFLPNMLAGVGAVQAGLFVVAATEGWKPQSEEHLRILELLGVADGVVALTKVGLVDEDTAELARPEVGDRPAGAGPGPAAPRRGGRARGAGPPGGREPGGRGAGRGGPGRRRPPRRAVGGHHPGGRPPAGARRPRPRRVPPRRLRAARRHRR